MGEQHHLVAMGWGIVLSRRLPCGLKVEGRDPDSPCPASTFGSIES